MLFTDTRHSIHRLFVDFSFSVALDKCSDLLNTDHSARAAIIRKSLENVSMSSLLPILHDSLSTVTLRFFVMPFLFPVRVLLIQCYAFYVAEEVECHHQDCSCDIKQNKVGEKG